jgi:hypothetical protein
MIILHEHWWNWFRGNSTFRNTDFFYPFDLAFGFSEIFSFQYSEQCNRAPFFKNDEIVPFRVAKTNKTKNVTVDGNFFKQVNVCDIEGKDSVCELFLKDYNNNILNTFYVTGKIESRGLSATNNGVLQSKLSIMQRLAPLRSTL